MCESTRHHQHVWKFGVSFLARIPRYGNPCNTCVFPAALHPVMPGNVRQAIQATQHMWVKWRELPAAVICSARCSPNASGSNIQAWRGTAPHTTDGQKACNLGEGQNSRPPGPRSSDSSHRSVTCSPSYLEDHAGSERTDTNMSLFVQIWPSLANVNIAPAAVRKPRIEFPTPTCRAYVNIMVAVGMQIVYNIQRVLRHRQDTRKVGK